MAPSVTDSGLGLIPMQPANYSGVVEHNGREYVVLRNANGILAVYRIRNDGMLKALRRWPAKFNEEV